MVSIGGATIKVARRLSPAIWLAVIAGTTGTNLLDFATLPVAGHKPGAGFVLSAIVRIVIVLWIAFAAQRALAGGDRPFQPSRAMGRFVLLVIAGMILTAVATKIAGFLRGPGPVPLATDWLVAFLALAVIGLLTARMLAWLCGMAMGEPFAALPGLWRGQAHHSGTVITVFAGLILPILALHGALTMIVLRIAMPMEMRLAIGVIDGVISAIQLILTSALGTVGWKIARQIEAAPATR